MTSADTQIGQRTEDELIAEVIRDRHSHRLGDDDLQEAINVAKGVRRMRDSDSIMAAGADGQARVLQDRFSIDYDDVADAARTLRITGETSGGTGGTNDLSDDDIVSDGELEFVADLKREAGSLHDVDPSEFALVPREFSDLLRRIRDADDVDPDELALAPKDDVSDTVDQKDRLRESLADSRGVDPEELTDLSLSSLRALADADGGSGGRPNPRSKAVEKSGVARSDRAEYEDLKETREFLADKSGALAENRIEEIEARMAELERGG